MSKTVGKTNNLNANQELFCIEYVKDMNASRAYRDVYKPWAKKTADTNGWRMLQDERIQKRIAEELEGKFKKAWWEAQDVIDSLIDLAEKCLQRKPIKKYNKKTGEYEEHYTFDSSWANSALEKLGKYHALFTNKVDVKVSGLEEAFNEILDERD